MSIEGEPVTNKTLLALYDPADKIATRTILRAALYAIKALKSGDASVRCTITQLDEWCVDLTIEIEACEPELAL